MISNPASPPSSTEPRWVRVAWLGAGVASGAAAVWVFYVHPWLGVTTTLDRWLDHFGCLIPVLCAGPLAAVSQPGLLGAALAVGLSGAGFRQWPFKQTSTDSARIPRDPGTQARWTPVFVSGTLALGLWLTAYQAVVVLAGGAPPAYVWLTVMGCCLLGGALWDAAGGWAPLLVTLRDLSTATSMAAVVMGVGCIGGGRRVGIAFLAAVLIFATVRWRAARSGSPRRALEYFVVLALTVGALALAMSRARSWRFAFIGDEWGFYLLARQLLHGQGVPILGLPHAEAYHGNLSSYWQAWVMHMAGEDIYGWRLSSVLPFALSVPPLYVFIRWLAGVEAAVLGASLFATSHVLLMFSLVPYNNTQALLPLTLGLGFFAWAAARPSALRYVLAGMAIGLGMFVYGLGRLAVIPVGILLFTSSWPRRSFTVSGALPAGLGALAVATPMLFNLASWRAMLRATPMRAEAISASLGEQLAGNAVWGLLAFLRGTHTSHYVSGPHTDPLTAILVLVGLGCVLANLGNKAVRTWLIAGGAFAAAVCVVQQYRSPSHTRMFILPVVYTVFAGIGGSAAAQLLVPQSRKRRGVVIGCLVLVGVALNLHHIERISLARSAWTVEDLIIQQLQATAAADGGGLKTFVVLGAEIASHHVAIAQAYDVRRERLVYLRSSEAIDEPDLCSAGSQPAMALAHAREAPVDEIRARIAACWPGYHETIVRNHAGEAALYRFVTALAP